MDKLKMHSPDLQQQNIAHLAELFPGCVTEARDEAGALRRVVDFDQLRQELSDHIVEGPQERYQLNWPGKREALVTANAPIAKTLRPFRGESVNFDTTSNLFIEGDNLEALKLLQETYLGKVKLIYIDPPYNTGNDFIYDDNFSESSAEFLRKSNQKDDIGNRLISNEDSNGRFHSNWLRMIYSRLKIAKNLLSENGCVGISIDENELQNLWKICDEVFGSNNLIECVVYNKKSSAKGVPPKNMIVGVHEYVLFFQKTIKFSFIGIPRSEEGFENPDNDVRGPWRNTNLKSTTKDPSEAFSITDPNTGFSYTDVWAHSKTEMIRMIKDGELIFPECAEGQVRKKEYFYEFNNSNTPIKSSWGLYDAQYNTQMLEKLLGGKYFQGPKHITLMRDIIKQIASEGDVIIDLFSGSSTTMHATLLQNSQDGINRRVISIQLPEVTGENSSAHRAGYTTIAEIAKERIRRAGAQILKGSHHPDWNRDIGFRVLKIDSSNMVDLYYTPDQTDQNDLMDRVSNIKPDRTAEDLLFQVMVDWAVDLTLPITRRTILGKTVYCVNKKPYDLVACFDEGITEEMIKELAGYSPLRLVLRDTGFASDAVKINAVEIFKQLSEKTDVKAI